MITKPSRVLEKVKSTVERNIENNSGDNVFICNYIRRLYLGGNISSGCLDSLLTFIRASLEGCSTLNSWIVEECGLSGDDTDTLPFKEVNATRLKWIDWMIEQFEAVGQ